MATPNAPSKLILARQYLAFRRKLGYRMRSAEVLVDFACFADREAPGSPLTTALAIRWAMAVPSARPKTRVGRLSVVRGFARYCASLDSRNQVPDPNLLGPGFQRVAPHLFTSAEVSLILKCTEHLETGHSPLHPLTYQTLIGLLASTGMRPGEALRLHCCDLDVDEATLRIRQCKFSPERVLALHPTTVRALQSYRQKRQALFPWGETLFVGATGQPLSARRAEKVFRRLTRGLVARSEKRPVRLMDFRHTFASERIAQWSRQSQPIAHHLLLLARYLGHRTFNSTWWYVSSDPLALRAASERSRHFHKDHHAS
ncbi:MAG TPA: tyrosine-type recombinase/integrase [Verrucomicrobiota bacterium]|jgi:integrase|nr:tyrosine-type recombinase/integrase [Verrucomicrobiota bacterium]HQL79112.1 tyrosine-type recombinase/integrase [Verrucomicrobiota bacterium]